MDMMVSIMIPCYNGEHFVSRLFDSILNQTYNDIEVIFVNDGSIDNTEEVVLSYREKFDKKGMFFQYLKQDNKGQAAAINTALKYIHGKYVMWIDSDDYISVNHIERKVNYLEENTDIEILMSRGIIVNKTLSEIGSLGEELPTGTLFEDVLLEYRRCSAGLYMIRTEFLRKRIPDLNIIESHVGQNMQLLLPTTYKGNIGYINEKLFYYVVRDNSHSHSIVGIPQIYQRKQDILKLKKDILNTMTMDLNYKKFLFDLLEMRYLYDIIKFISETPFSEKDEKLIKRIIQESIQSKWIDFPDNKNIYIWGACEKNYRLKTYLEQYTSIKVYGFIETTDKECDYHKIKPDELDKESMYVFIPLDYHQEIVEILREKGFTKRDMCYLKKEITHSLKGGFHVVDK